MNKHSNIISSMIIFMGLVFLGFSIMFAANTLKPKDESRYQLVQLNGVNMALIDRKTDKIYYKFIDPSSAPTNWQELILPN